MKRKRSKFIALLTAVVVVCICTTPLSAAYIVGDSNATLVVGGDYNGWYFYEMSIQWNLNSTGSGLSHFDLIFKDGCPTASEPNNFALPAGQSTGEDYPDDPTAVDWIGYFQIGDPSLDPPLANPILKYNEYSLNPGAEGYGTFSFYSIAEPITGTFTNALVAKAGVGISDTYGDLTGEVPECIVPEPATILLLGLGAFALLRKRRT